jgi:hypothetical protein
LLKDHIVGEASCRDYFGKGNTGKRQGQYNGKKQISANNEKKRFGSHSNNKAGIIDEEVKIADWYQQYTIAIGPSKESPTKGGGF